MISSFGENRLRGNSADHRDWTMSRLCGIPMSSFILIAISYGFQLNEDDDDDGYDDYDYEKEMRNNDGKHHPTGSTYQVDNQWPPMAKHSIPCYTCHFIFQHDHQQGPINCKDPFTSLGIPQIDCFGACAKIYRKLEGKSDFELSRNCMPNCKEFRSERGSIECCTTELCNGAVAAASFNDYRTLATLYVTLLISLLLMLLLR